MKTFSFHTVIIGGGPTGCAAALHLAPHHSVCVIEAHELGGVCLNRGCMPTKVLVAASRKMQETTRMTQWGIGGAATPSFDFAVFKKYQRGVIDRLKKGLDFSLRNAKVTVIRGVAAFVDATHVRVVPDDENEQCEITFEHCIIATGSVPVVPEAWKQVLGVVDSETFWQLETVPQNIAIIGGGVIGCEYASALSILGYKVTLVEKLPRILTIEDDDVANAVATELKKRGVTILTAATVQSITHADNHVHITLDDTTIDAELAVVCMGRARQHATLELGKLGIEQTTLTDIGRVPMLQFSSVKNIWIAGDATYGPQLAHKGHADAYAIAYAILNGKNADFPHYGTIPMATYTTPEVSRVGCTEREAKEKGNYVVVKVQFSGIGKAVVENHTRGWLTLIADVSSKKILGITVVGSGAAEFSGYSLLILRNAMTTMDLASFHFAHPTVGEIFQVAAEQVST